MFYRLYVIPVNLPPLRQRKTDISHLVSHFIIESNEKNHRTVEGIDDQALEMMFAYNWPGNVRELKNMVERLVVLKGDGCIEPKDLPRELSSKIPSFDTPGAIQISDDGICLNSAVTEFEKALILQSLEKTKWVKNKAAKLLQLNRTTLVEKIKRHHLQPCST